MTGKDAEKSQSHKIEIRRRRVRRLFARGAGPSEIAAQVDCSRSTVRRDLDAIKDELQEELTNLQEGKVEEFLQELIANFDTVNEELWTKYSQSGHDSIQLGALKAIIRLQESKVDILQKMGILDKVADQMELDVTGSGEFNFNILTVDLEDQEGLDELLGGQPLDELELDGSVQARA